MSKKAYIWISLILILITISGIITAFLLTQDILDEEHTVGFVEADYDIYFVNDNIRYEASEVTIPNTSYVKKGVYYVDVVNSGANDFIENLRIDFKVSSNVDTWIRIKLVETLIFKSENQLGLITESSITTAPTEYFIANNWYNNQATDGYYYYQNAIKRVNETTANTISFIPSYFEGRFYNARPQGYEIQIGIIVEAVHYYEGPLHNWSYPTPPWGGTWT